MLVLAALVLAIGCGGSVDTDVQSGSGPTRFHGVSAQFGHRQGGSEEQPVRLLAIGIYDVPLWCSAADAGTAPETLAVLLIEIVKFSVEPVGVGTYSLYRHDGVLKEGSTAYFYTLPWGPAAASVEGASGRVTMSRVDTSAAEGDLDLILEDGTHIEGPFSAIDCIQ